MLSYRVQAASRVQRGYVGKWRKPCDRLRVQRVQPLSVAKAKKVRTAVDSSSKFDHYLNKLILSTVAAVLATAALGVVIAFR
jgi:hypothetical protein